jgi:hypothetical protein
MKKIATITIMHRTLRAVLLCVMVFLLTSKVSFAQNDSNFQFIKTIAGDYSYFDVDNLDNIFLITRNNQLKKLNNNGDSIAVYNDVKKYGNPSSIDVTNPLKILLYYNNYATVVILDRLLSVRNSINFRKQNIFSVQRIAASYDNNIWLFDEQDYKLKKIDEDGKLLQESTDWRMLFDSVPVPEALIDQNQFVYLYDPQKGFYVFDYYGGFKNRYAFLNWNQVAVTAKTLYGFSDQTLYSYTLNSMQLKAFPLPSFFGDYLSIKAMNGKLYVLTTGGIDIYQMK